MAGSALGFIAGDMECGVPEAIGMVTDTDTEGAITMDTGGDIVQAGVPVTVPEVVIALICTEIVPRAFVLPDQQGIQQPELIRREHNHGLRTSPIICTPIKVGMCTGSKIMGMYNSDLMANGKIVKTARGRAR